MLRHPHNKFIKAYYLTNKIIGGDERPYELQRLTTGMLGFENTAHKVKCKAAEARTLLGFGVQIALEHRGAIGSFFASAGLQLQQLYEIFRLQQRVMPVPDRIRAVELAYGFLMALKRSGGHFSPKHHLFCHLMDDIRKHGNPRHILNQNRSKDKISRVRSNFERTVLVTNARYYHTYVDETLNGEYAKLANKCHPRTLNSVLWRRVLFAESRC